MLVEWKLTGSSLDKKKDTVKKWAPNLGLGVNKKNTLSKRNNELLLRNFVANFAWGVQAVISIFLFSCVALLPSALKVSNSSTSVKHESKRLRLAS